MFIKVRIYIVIYVILFRGKNYNFVFVDVLLKYLFKLLCIIENKFLYLIGGYFLFFEVGIKVIILLCYIFFVWFSLEKEGYEEIWGYLEIVVCFIFNRKSGKNILYF